MDITTGNYVIGYLRSAVNHVNVPIPMYVHVETSILSITNASIWKRLPVS